MPEDNFVPSLQADDEDDEISAKVKAHNMKGQEERERIRRNFEEKLFVKARREEARKYANEMFKSGKLAFVDSLATRAGTLDQAFWTKMGRLLTLWRFRRGVSAVRCLLFLEAKMRRLRALWKFRRSATIANLVGRSWVRRANEIRYGRAIAVVQAEGKLCTTPWAGVYGAPFDIGTSAGIGIGASSLTADKRRALRTLTSERTTHHQLHHYLRSMPVPSGACSAM